MIKKFSFYALTILALAACQTAQTPELDLNENSVRDDVEAALKSEYLEDNQALFSALMAVAAATELSITYVEKKI